MRHPKKDTHEEDIVVEEDAAPHSSFKHKTDSDLKKELEHAKKERAEYLDGWQRAKAELVNSKKTFENDKKRYRDLATEDIISELIPVLDSFDMAFRDKNAWESAPENWRRGVEYIYNQLLAVLERNNVTQIAPVGAPFNPAEHESIGVTPVETEREHHKVQTVAQKGYRLKDKVIRAARVTVGEYKS